MINVPANAMTQGMHPSGRYIEALRAQMRERITQEKVDLPALCCCGDSFWDSHPDTCANNCVFYKNPKGSVSHKEGQGIK